MRFDPATHTVHAAGRSWFAKVNARLDLIQDDIAGIKLELATHRHDEP